MCHVEQDCFVGYFCAANVMFSFRPVCDHPGMATSQDGLAWEKKGPVFDGGPEGAFDEMGAGRRRIVMHDG